MNKLAKSWHTPFLLMNTSYGVVSSRVLPGHLDLAEQGEVDGEKRFDQVVVVAFDKRHGVVAQLAQLRFGQLDGGRYGESIMCSHGIQTRGNDGRIGPREKANGSTPDKLIVDSAATVVRCTAGRSRIDRSSCRRHLRVPRPERWEQSTTDSSQLADRRRRSAASERNARSANGLVVTITSDMLDSQAPLAVKNVSRVAMVRVPTNTGGEITIQRLPVSCFFTPSTG